MLEARRGLEARQMLVAKYIIALPTAEFFNHSQQQEKHKQQGAV